MNGYIVFGVFSLYVAITSLFLVLSGYQDGLLARLRSFWGRRTGHSLYFLFNVALPLLICVLCLGWGVRVYDATAAVTASRLPLQLEAQSCRDLRLLLQMQGDLTQIEVVYGA